MTRTAEETIHSARFSPQELANLSAVRARFQDNHDSFADVELARLRFVRWLYQTGRTMGQRRLDAS